MKFTRYIFILFFLTIVTAQNSILHPIKIDGVRNFYYDRYNPYSLANNSSIIYVTPQEDYPFTMLDPVFSMAPDFLPKDSVNSYKNWLYYQASAKAGSEIGELLFDSGKNSENRDHQSNLTTAIKIPKTLLHAVFGYRYADTYSDRFDRYWQNLDSHKQGKGITDTTKGFKEPLAKEFIYGLAYRNTDLTTSLLIENYKRWGLTPFYFTPLYTRGWYGQLLSKYTIGNNSFTLNITGDKPREYYLIYFSHPKENEYEHTIDFTWKRDFSKTLNWSLGYHRDSRLTPKSYVQTSIDDSITGYLSWSLGGKIYQGFRPAASLEATFYRIPRITIDVKGAWDMIRPRESFTYLNIDRIVNYQYKRQDYLSLHAKVSYDDTLWFPVNLSLWTSYNSAPLWEKYRNRSGNRVDIVVDTLGEQSNHLTIGAEGSYIMTWGNFSTKLWAHGLVNPTDSYLRYSVPYEYGINFSYGQPDHLTKIYSEFSIYSRSETTLNYYNSRIDEIDSYASPAQTSLSCLVQIPFRFPFFRDYTRTNFTIQADPIRISTNWKEQRFKEHPMGNLIGPQISFLLKGYIEKK